MLRLRFQKYLNEEILSANADSVNAIIKNLRELCQNIMDETNDYQTPEKVKKLARIAEDAVKKLKELQTFLQKEWE